MRQHSVRRLGALLGGAFLLLGLGSCEVKDSSFFVVGTGTPGNSGTLGVIVTGTPAGASVRITGPGTDKTVTVGDQGASFANAAFGTYTITVTPPSGYTCTPTTRTVTLSDTDPTGSATFDCTPIPGTVSFTSTGLAGSTAFGISLMDGTTLTGQLGSSGATFTNVHPGDWSWQLGTTVGFTCTPMNGNFTLDPGATFTQAISCVSQLGTLAMAVTGTGTTHTVNYTGPQSGSVQAGETPVTANVTPGQYTISFLTPPSGYTCVNPSPVTVTAGQTTTATLACSADPGTITVTQAAAPSAVVDYTGPVSGSLNAPNGTPVPVPNLPAGMYTFTITDPSGFTCTPSSVPVTLAPGGTEDAQFTCTTSGGGLPTTVGVDLANLQGSAGAVPSGTYTRPLLDGATPVGTIDVSTIGAQTFYGTSPFRLGSGPNSGWRFQLGVSVNSQPYSVSGFAVCALNTTLDVSHTMDITYRDASLSSLGVDHVDTAPMCFWGTVPGGTMYIDVTGPNDRFIDINGLQLWH